MVTLPIIISLTTTAVSVIGFLIMIARLIYSKAKTEERIQSAIATIEKQRCSDMEIQVLKMTNLSERLFEHIGTNDRDHNDFSRMFTTIESSLHEIQKGIAVLEERSCKD